MDEIQEELDAMRDRCMRQDSVDTGDVLNRVIELTAIVGNLVAVIQRSQKARIIET